MRFLFRLFGTDRSSFARAFRWYASHLIYPFAILYRITLLRRVVFIGVTGSTGKTTTKELIHAILSTSMDGRKSEGNSNTSIHETTLSVRPWHKYCVQEIAAALGGYRIRLERPLRLVRPHIGVVTNVGLDHLTAFGSVEAIAEEKGKLIATLPTTGVAVLNADDPKVMAMRSRCCARVVTYGVANDATIRAENVSCRWPEPLSFDLVYGGRRQAVRTQLCGTHWVPCVLAAIAVALEMGIPLAVALRTLESVPPAEMRMQPVSRSDGVTFIRDDAKAPLASVHLALQFMENATAARKIVVIGTISDYVGNSETIYKNVAKHALDIADIVIFVGPKSSKAGKARRHPKGNALHTFPTVEAASKFLAEVILPGDLVLLKGSSPADDLEPLVVVERKPRQAVAGPLENLAWSASDKAQLTIIGLGNPEDQYKDTPHSVGHRVLDRLATMLHANWTEAPRAMVADAEWQGSKLCLIKIMSPMNFSGAVVQELSHGLGFDCADCVLVHDDLDLSLGATRTRLKGSAGGHKGVRSILEVFGTDAVARVKIGIGRPEKGSKAAEHVLRRFSPDELPAIEDGCAAAIEKILKMVATPIRLTENKKITA